eukprot:292479_1
MKPSGAQIESSTILTELSDILFLKAKKTSKQHPQQNRKTKKKPKKRSTTASEYDPPNSCKKQNVMIPRTLTTEIIPQGIKEELYDVFDYMDKSLALQYTGDVNNGIVVLN